MNPPDRDLGMDRDISRRDFLNGVAVTVGTLPAAAMLSAQQQSADLTDTLNREKGSDSSAQDPLLAQGITETDPRYYPPALTGMRGSHPGSFEVAHAMRDGTRFGSPANTGERYDLVIVGAGISGLAAAYLFRSDVGRNSKILLLDNHDDFGGHAKRNEFTYNGRTLLLNGGTSNLEVTDQYSAVSRTLLRAIGVDFGRLAKASNSSGEFYNSMKLGSATFFCKEIFGRDQLVLGSPTRRGPGNGSNSSAGGNAGEVAKWLSQTPLSPTAQRDIARLYNEGSHYWQELSPADKKRRLAKISYKDFLLNVAKVSPDAIPFLAQYGADRHEVDTMPALYAMNSGAPGFRGIELEPPSKVSPLTHLGGTQHGAEVVFGGGPTLEFPDGNATIARLLVRQLIPDSMPGNTMEDVVTARANYAGLDRSDLPVRLRLNSTVVQVRHLGSSDKATEVEVAYLRGGKAQTVRAQHVILACWNMLIPYICPDVPQVQRRALAYSVKKTMVYTSVCMRNWKPFVELGVRNVVCPGMFHEGFSLGRAPVFGDYRGPRSPEEPMALNMERTWFGPGKTERDRFRTGRAAMLSTSFETFERKIRDQLARGLAGTSFDPAADVVAITVNRWPHGSAYLYNSLFDPIRWSLMEAGDKPNVVGRRQIGRISIANCDAAASSHTDAAIDEAYRAVGEQLVLREAS